MDLARPFEVVTPTLDGVVLQVLAARKPNDPPTVAEIRRDAGEGSEFGLRKVLKRLVAQGIVEELPQYGAWATVYRLNRFHLAYDAVVTLARQRDLLRERLADETADIPRLVHVELLEPPVGQLLLVAEPSPAGRLVGVEDVRQLQVMVRRWTGVEVTVRAIAAGDWERANDWERARDHD